MFKSSIVYLLSTLFNRAIPLLLLPILTRYLSPAEYGTIAILQVFLALFQSFFGGLNVNISRNYFSMGRLRFQSYMTAVFVVLGILFLGSMALSLLYLATGYSLFGLTRNWFLAMPVIACMSMANLLNLTLLRTEERPYRYASWEISNGVLNLVLTLLLLLAFQLGWAARAYGITIPIIIYGVLGILAISRRSMLPLRFRWRDVKETLGISLVLIPHTMSAFIVSFLDRIFIKEMMGVDHVGIYTIGYQFGTLTMFITVAFLKAWQPWFFKKIASNSVEDRGEIVRNTWVYLGLLIFGSVLYLCLAYIALPFVVDERYWEARSVLFPLVMASVAYGAYQIFFPYLVHLKLTHLLAIATPVGALINIVLNLTLIPQFGIVGAAYATLCAYLFTFVYVASIGCRRIALPWFSWRV